MQIVSPALRFYFKERFNAITYSVVALLVIGSYVLAYLLIPSNDNTPLHYNIYFGIDFIGDSSLVYLIPTAILILTLLNITVGLMVWRHDRVLGYFVAMGTLCVAIIGAVAMALIINLAR
jgi:hypothetical protein